MMWMIAAALWLAGACSFYCIGAISKRGDRLVEHMQSAKETHP